MTASCIVLVNRVGIDYGKTRKQLSMLFATVLYYWIKKIRIANQINPLTPMGDLDRISLYNNYQHNIKQTSNEKKEKSSLGDYWLIQYQILQTNITRTIWQTVRRITNEILGVKGLKENIRSSWCEFTVKSSKLPQDQLQLVLVLNLIGWDWDWVFWTNHSKEKLKFAQWSWSQELFDWTHFETNSIGGW